MNTLAKTNNRVSPLDALFQEVENWFGNGAWSPMDSSVEGYGYPVVNITGNDELLHVQAEIPGVDPAKLDVQVEGRILTIEGERPAVELPEGAAWVRRERSAGAFKRAYRLPYEVENGQVKAAYLNGVLQLTLPRHEASKPKKISIKVK